MREIKFRAWEKIEKRMYSPKDIEDGNFALGSQGLMVWHEKDSKHLWNVDHRFIPLLFIGVKDKNGKEIYEGDIVSYRHGKGNVFYHDAACLFMIDSIIYKYRPMDDWSEFIVIGNIYENPMLLEISMKIKMSQ